MAEGEILEENETNLDLHAKNLSNKFVLKSKAVTTAKKNKRRLVKIKGVLAPNYVLSLYKHRLSGEDVTFKEFSKAANFTIFLPFQPLLRHFLVRSLKTKMMTTTVKKLSLLTTLTTVIMAKATTIITILELMTDLTVSLQIMLGKRRTRRKRGRKRRRRRKRTATTPSGPLLVRVQVLPLPLPRSQI